MLIGLQTETAEGYTKTTTASTCTLTFPRRLSCVSKQNWCFAKCRTAQLCCTALGKRESSIYGAQQLLLEQKQLGMSSKTLELNFHCDAWNHMAEVSSKSNAVLLNVLCMRELGQSDIGLKSVTKSFGCHNELQIGQKSPGSSKL